MSKFKPGDKVRRIVSDGPDIRVNDVATISKVISNIIVNLEGFPQSQGFCSTFFELVEEAKQVKPKAKNNVLYEFTSQSHSAVNLAELCESCTRENKFLVVKMESKSLRQFAVVVHGSIINKSNEVGMVCPVDYYSMLLYSEFAFDNKLTVAFMVDQDAINEIKQWVKEVEQEPWPDREVVNVTVQNVEV